MALRKLVRRARRKLGLAKPPVPKSLTWSRAEDNPSDAQPLEHFRLFAVLGTWTEADVVEACVQNAFAQGCERVYLVDNDSPDNTVEIAVATGAILARSYATETYDELLRMEIMNDVVEETSRAEPDNHVWWLWLDADEFAHGAAGMTIREQLAVLDRRFRVVGTRYFNHYPSETPHYVPGRHPLDYQPLAEELAPRFCPLYHRKHPLQRWDRSGPRIECGPGFHRVFCDDVVSEPTMSAFLHHFPFREETLSRYRLDLLCGAQTDRAQPNDPATDHMLSRYRSLEAVYEQRWADVENFMPGAEQGVSLAPWASFVDERDLAIVRWYEPEHET